MIQNNYNLGGTSTNIGVQNNHTNAQTPTNADDIRAQLENILTLLADANAGRERELAALRAAVEDGDTALAKSRWRQLVNAGVQNAPLVSAASALITMLGGLT